MDTKTRGESTGFDELLEGRLTELLAKVGNADLEDLEEELASLHSLIDLYKHIDELLENLFTPGVDQETRPERLSSLRDQRIRVLENRAEAERLHAKSHSILEHSAQILAEIDRRIFEKTNKGSAYAPELCGLCRGIGRRSSAPCVACKGKRTVLVYQPALKCPRCGGSGQADEHDRINFGLSLCLICHGTGWVMVGGDGFEIQSEID